jgi:small subunit ribosomal protein S21
MIRIILRQGEPIQAAVRRFRNLIERSGLMREVRKRAYFQKPSSRKHVSKTKQRRAVKKNDR